MSFVEEICLAGIRRPATPMHRAHGAPVCIATTAILSISCFGAGMTPGCGPLAVTGILKPYCGQVLCPTLIIQGEDDEYGSRAQVDAIAAGVSGPLTSCGYPVVAMRPIINRERPYWILLQALLTGSALISNIDVLQPSNPG
jgi:hypothetical protein